MIKAKDAIDVKKVTQESVRAHVRGEMETLIEANAPPELLVLLERETDGGQCPRCEKHWQKIEVKNTFADFFYFTPSCNCYTKCNPGQSFAYRGVRKRREGEIKIAYVPTKRYVMSGCGGSKHREDVLGISRCLSCGFDPAAEARRKEKAETGSIDKYKKTMGVDE